MRNFILSCFRIGQLCWICLLLGELSLIITMSMQQRLNGSKASSSTVLFCNQPRQRRYYYYTSITKYWFQHGFVVPLASHSPVCLKWTNNHMVSYYHTVKEHRIIAHKHWTCKRSCRMTQYTQTCGCSLWQMTVRFFGRLKYIVVVGWRHVTTWHWDAYISCITS